MHTARWVTSTNNQARQVKSSSIHGGDYAEYSGVGFDQIYNIFTLTILDRDLVVQLGTWALEDNDCDRSCTETHSSYGQGLPHQKVSTSVTMTKHYHESGSRCICWMMMASIGNCKKIVNKRRVLRFQKGCPILSFVRVELIDWLIN